MTRRAARKPSYSEPYFLLLLFASLALGTVLIDQRARFALLWAALAVLSLVYRSQKKVELQFDLTGLGRGVLMGAVISIPLLAFLSGQLQRFTESIYGTSDVVDLFYQTCFVAAPVEEYFFRGVMQTSKGTSVALAVYVGVALLFFLPHVPILAALLMVVALGLLGLVFGYVAEHYGLTAAIACHMVVGLVLQVVPSLFSAVRLMLV